MPDPLLYCDRNDPCFARPRYGQRLALDQFLRSLGCPRTHHVPVRDVVEISGEYLRVTGFGRNGNR